MKRIVFFIACMLFGITLTFAQGKAEMKISETVHDFGEILEEDGDVTCEFIITNTGDAPLELTNVSASCGCTTPDWTKTPIAPGKTGFVKATYKVRGSGSSFSKAVSIFSNAQEAPFVVTIKGKVIKKQVEQPQSQSPVSVSPSPIEDLQLQQTTVNLDATKEAIKDAAKERPVRKKK